ncbi:hypothetical protein BC830DRAFT_91116 [Chytriomyces sp. MP71]|nr:hypothetical protein BC830DRAFT_91116 [Chytriomyces sp. MP71]
MRAQAFVFAMGLKSAFAIPLKPEWQAKMAANDTLVAVDIPTTHNLERDLVMERDDNSNGHMTDCQYSIMLQITSYCETSSLKL